MFTAEPMPHEGEELIFMIDRKQEFSYNGESQILEEGDCYYFGFKQTTLRKRY